MMDEPIDMLQNPVWLEEMVILRLFQDGQFGQTYLNFFNQTKSDKSRFAEPCDDFSDPIHEACFQAAKMYRTSIPYDGKPFSLDFFGRCLKSLSDHGMYIREAEIPEAMQRTSRILSLPIEAAVQLTGTYLLDWLKRRRTKFITTQFTGTGKPPGWLQDRLNEEMRKLDHVVLGAAADRLRPFGYGLDNPEKDVPRIITRLPTLNRVTGGGIGKGEGTLVIAPSGVGKTTAGCQFAVDFVNLSRQKGLYVTTEEPQVKIERRMVSNLCNIPISQIKDNFDINTFGDAQRQAYDKMRTCYNQQNFHIFHWPKNSTMSIEKGLEEQIDRAAQVMGGIDFVILDWLGAALGGMETDDRKLRLSYHNGAANMARIAEAWKIATVTFAQTTEKGKGIALVDSRHLAECKTAHWEMTTVLGMSGLLNDEAAYDAGKSIYRKEQNIFISKARYGEGGVVKIHRQMDFQRINDAHSVPR